MDPEDAEVRSVRERCTAAFPSRAHVFPVARVPIDGGVGVASPACAWQADPCPFARDQHSVATEKMVRAHAKWRECDCSMFRMSEGEGDLMVRAHAGDGFEDWMSPAWMFSTARLDALASEAQVTRAQGGGRAQGGRASVAGERERLRARAFEEEQNTRASEEEHTAGAVLRALRPSAQRERWGEPVSAGVGLLANRRRRRRRRRRRTRRTRTRRRCACCPHARAQRAAAREACRGSSGEGRASVVGERERLREACRGASGEGRASVVGERERLRARAFEEEQNTRASEEEHTAGAVLRA